MKLVSKSLLVLGVVVLACILVGKSGDPEEAGLREVTEEAAQLAEQVSKMTAEVLDTANQVQAGLKPLEADLEPDEEFLFSMQQRSDLLRSQVKEAERMGKLAGASTRVMDEAFRDVPNGAARTCVHADTISSSVFPQERQKLLEESQAIRRQSDIALEEARKASERLLQLRNHLSRLLTESRSFVTTVESKAAQSYLEPPEIASLEQLLNEARTTLTAAELKKEQLRELAKKGRQDWSRADERPESNGEIRRLFSLESKAVEDVVVAEDALIKATDQLKALRENSQRVRHRELQSLRMIVDREDAVSTMDGIYRSTVAAQLVAEEHMEVIEEQAELQRTCLELAQKTAAAPIEIEVPDLVGMTEEAALRVMARRNLKLVILPSEEAPDQASGGRIFHQRPVAQATLGPGQDVTVKMYGPYGADTFVPVLEGLSVDVAQGTLSGSGLLMVPVPGDPAPSPGDAFTVQQQSPRAGRLVTPGSMINVQVYGPYIPTRTIPGLKGLTTTTAKSVLMQSTFKAKIVNGAPAPSPDKQGIVIDQSPLEGSRYPEGGEVTVIVYAPYERDREVPDLVGLSRDRARLALETLGMRYEFAVGAPAPTKGMEGLVYAQFPSSGRMVDRRQAKVTLTVFDKTAIQAPPIKDVTSAPGVSKEYFIVCQPYFPSLPGTLPSGAKYRDVVPTFTPEKTQFIPTGRPFILQIAEEARKGYPIDMFARGKRFSTNISVQINGGTQKDRMTLSGALLFETLDVFEDEAKLTTRYKNAIDPRGTGGWNFLRLARSDGRFMSRDAGGGATIEYSGGPIVEGWPRTMKVRNIELFAQVVRYTDCFVVTAVYQSLTAPELQALRQFRDRMLLHTVAGRRLVRLYESYGPIWAAYLHNHPELASRTRPALRMVAGVLAEVDTDNAAIRQIVDTLSTAADACMTVMGIEPSRDKE